LRNSLRHLKMPSTRWILASIILLGIALRLYLLFSSQVIIEADEALVGLQAFGILRGERPIFYPAQLHNGSFESYLVALVFMLLGPSPLTLKLVPLAFSIGFIFATYRLAKEIYNPQAGLLSALLVALCPLLLTSVSLKAWAGYIETPVLGSVALLLLYRALYVEKEMKQRRIAILALGVVSGLGLWVNPQYFYYLGPVTLLLFIKVKQVGLVGLAAFAMGGLFGGVPLLIGYLNPAEGIVATSFAEGVVPAQDFWLYLEAAIRYFFADGLLTLWGVRPIRGELAFSPLFAVVPIYLAAIASAFWQKGKESLERPNNPSIILLAFLLFSPFIFILGALTNGNYTVIIPDAGLLVRYITPLYTAMPILLARFIAHLFHSPERRRLAMALLSVVLLTNLWSNVAIDHVDAMRSVFENVPLPASNKALMDFLDSEGIRYVYTNHWIGFRLMFETQERVVTFDYPDSLYGMDRLPQYGHQVETAQVPPAYILFNPGWKQTPPLEKKFQGLGVNYEKKAFPPLEYIVYHRLSRKVHPSEVMETLVWPYY
jgi:4-amino-4-deoxy-L-arabinose transferase-like glycosyltransferase